MYPEAPVTGTSEPPSTLIWSLRVWTADSAWLDTTSHLRVLLGKKALTPFCHLFFPKVSY
jgi:hypothetical protein